MNKLNTGEFVRMFIQGQGNGHSFPDPAYSIYFVDGEKIEKRERTRVDWRKTLRDTAKSTILSRA